MSERVESGLVLKILGLASGEPCPADGEYLREYDPGRDGVAPDGTPMMAYLVTTPERAEARVFDSFSAAHAVWTAVDPRCPVRDDGAPNRPLTAFTITMEKVP